MIGMKKGLNLMKTKCLSAICLFMITVFQLSAFEAVNQPSLDSAKQWLELVDKGEYSKSWKTGSLTFKLTISEQHWNQIMKAIREPLGSLVSREPIEQRPAVNPKGLPQGNYMVIIFKTKFQKKQDAHELVTLVQESDGNWRVLTYQVQ